jgi:ATP-dependent RNA helicase DDX47/RRP3
MVCQYDVELYQKIEELIGKKLLVFAVEEEEVLILE